MQETLVQFLGQEDSRKRDRLPTSVFLGFSCGSAGEESTCNEGDLGSIPGLGRSPGEGNDYPTSVFWPGEFHGLTKTSLVAQIAKISPAMWESWVRSLGWEDPLEEGMATYSSILAWRILWTEESGGLQSMELQFSSFPSQKA